MPSFEYLALSAAGAKERGFVEADSERAARQQLRDKQLTPVEVNQAQVREKRLQWQRSVPNSELSLFTRHLAALIQSAVPLEEALSACAKQTNHRRLKAIILNLRSKVLEGQSLSYALSEHPRIFPSIFRALVAAGEQSGSLAAVLVRLAEYSEKSQRLRNQVLQASVYPVVLCLVASAVIALLMVFVVPRVVEQFDRADQQLPWLTDLMISISNAMQAYGAAGLLLLLCLSVGLQRTFRQESRKRWLHHKLLSVPLVKGVLIRLETARLFSTLSIMHASGVPMLDALQTARATLGNLHIQKLVSQAADQVKEGRSISKSLEEADIFPAVSIYMLANGEHTGELGQALEYAANQQEDELNSFIGIATSLLEPLMIVVFGVVVLAIVLAILLPILQLNSFTQF